MKKLNNIVKRNLVGNIMDVINDSFPHMMPGVNEHQLVRKLYRSIDLSLDGHLQTEKKMVNILLSDLRGFSTMAEAYSPVELLELLNRYFLKMSEVILKYNGVIDKFMGDSIMVLFGIPQSRPDDLERTLACATEMQVVMSEINQLNESLGMPSLYMGIGINTGEVVAGTLGSELHNEYTVIGNEVNLVARVEAHSLRGQILLSENTYLKAKDYIQIGDINEVHVKGRKDAVRMYELLATDRPRYLQVPCREIRKSPRVKVNMPLAFHCVTDKEVQPDEYTGRIMDISYGGLFAVVPIGLRKHDEVQTTFSESLMRCCASDVFAKVTHVEKKNHEFGCHLEFTAIDRELKSELKDYIDLLIERLH
ncbi:MAG: PilZ domain-containing protein [Gammaproteobacteria bacterium]|nr:PilZ domain-containing protein [Gammaproteobacteria bacterium]MCW9005196.1 PilZ domain-containing protein [Gammaproteobacteria bacterium]